MAPGGTCGRSQNTRSTLLREPVEPREDQRGSYGLRVGESCPELRPRCALAALDFDVLGYEFPLAAIEIVGDRIALRFQPEATAALSIS
jgi:hypothetical protein